VQLVDLLCLGLRLAAGQQLPTDAAAGGACGARARQRPAPPGDRVLLAAPLAARARAGVPSRRRPQRRQTAAAVPTTRKYAPFPFFFSAIPSAVRFCSIELLHVQVSPAPETELFASGDNKQTVMTTSQIASCAFTVGTVAVLPFYTLMVVAPNADIVSHLPLLHTALRHNTTRHDMALLHPRSISPRHHVSLLLRADQTHGGEQRPLRRPRPPLRLPALPVLDPRHPSRHVREQVLAPRGTAAASFAETVTRSLNV
jgi:hypothetical protein